VASIFVEYASAAITGTEHMPLHIHLHAIGHSGFCGGHIRENPVVAQGSIGGHVKGPDTPVGADLVTLLLLQAPLVQAADGNIEDRLIRGESQPIGVLALIGGQMDLTIGINSIDAGEANLPLVLRDPSLGIGEVNAAIGAAYYVIRTVQSFAIPSVGQDSNGPVVLGAGHPAIASLTHEQTPLKVKGQPIALIGTLSDYLRLAAWDPPKEMVPSYVYKVQEAVRVPEWAFCEYKTCSYALGLPIQNGRQIVTHCNTSR
jgi:hypothetical protein